MARIPNTFNFPDPKDMDMTKLMLVLDRMYMDLAEAVNSKPDLYQRDTDGLTDDVSLANGSININSLTDKVEMLTNHIDPSTVTWTTLS